MNTLDIALVLALLIGFGYGYFKGIIKQLSFGAGIALGLLQAVLFYPTVAGWIKGYTQWADWIAIPAGFLAILISTIIIFKIAGVILSGILSLCHLKFIDGILGAIFSTIVAMFIFVGAVTLSEDIIPDNRYTGKTSQEQSLFYKHTQILTSLIIDEAEKKI